VATFDSSKLAANVIEDEMEFLNRCHINGVQFQDWHNKHHWPLGGTRGNLLATYKDIANREISTDVVKKYIAVQHGYGMKSIFYNLCYGALDDAAADGVKEQWYAFKNNRRGDKDVHSLPSSWKSSIYVLDPSNSEWLDYIAERNDEVYSSFDFDGYQIDQLGDRGTLYNYNGNTLNMPQGFATFINKMKQRHPSKRLIMNAVSSYGASQIVGTGKVDFCYNEVWGSEDKFQDLYTIIKANDSYSGNTLQTVFAAYMNYDYADTHTGEMNTPGVLMTDAVMMALGGSHLELGGDHMLSREYFPAAPLKMTDELKTAMIRYYDFMTAYENLLRGASSSAETTVTISCTDSSKKITFNNWPPQQRTVTTFAKEIDGKTVLHLLNFINIDDLSWRDLNCTRSIPQLKLSFPVAITTNKSVKKVWLASPDQHGGVAQELAFTLSNGTLSFTVPRLKYWDMIVIE
jgi:dextranase